MDKLDTILMTPMADVPFWWVLVGVTAIVVVFS